jgi:hypothetical protein
VKIPKIGAIHKKNADTKFTQSRYFFERGRVASKRELIGLPSLTSLGEGKQTLTAVDRRNIENRQVRAWSDF